MKIAPHTHTHTHARTHTGRQAHTHKYARTRAQDKAQHKINERTKLYTNYLPLLDQKATIILGKEQTDY